MNELEISVAKAVDELKRLRSENAELTERLRAVGKEIDDLGALIKEAGAGQKLDSKMKKRVGKRLKSMMDKIG